MTAPSRLSTFQKECNYDEWVRKIQSAENVSEDKKKQFIEHLNSTRHVMVVDMRQFFSDAIESGTLDAEDEPFAIVTKAYPFAILDSYGEVEAVTKFCESAGLSCEIHVYPTVSQAVN